MADIISEIRQELSSRPELLAQYNVHLAKTVGINRECIALVKTRDDAVAAENEKYIWHIDEVMKRFCHEFLK